MRTRATFTKVAVDHRHEPTGHRRLPRAHHATPLDRTEQDKQLAEAEKAIEAEEQVREEAQ